VAIANVLQLEAAAQRRASRSGCSLAKFVLYISRNCFHTVTLNVCSRPTSSVV